MLIHLSDTQQVEILVSDNSYRYRAIKRVGELNLYFSLPEHIEVPVGAWCEHQGEIYTLEKPENFKKNGTRNFEYTLIMESAEAKLKKYKYLDIVSGRLKFNLTAKPSEFLKLLVDNLNLREEGWQVGDCIDAPGKVLSFNHVYCSEALSQAAEAFETEWEFEGKKVHLRRAEHFKDNPLPMSYGRGNGFLPGLGRANYDNSKPVEILFVQGGERNIDPSKYGSRELLLPKGQTLEYEGRSYVTSPSGISIRRANKPLQSSEEDSLDCSHIYPSRVGEVSAVKVANADKNFYDFIDSSIPANLDFVKYLIQGETMTVIFQSGMLVSRELEVKYIHKDRRFEIVPQEIDGQTMPNDVFKPAVGDKYAVFGMSLPDEYVCDNATQTGASWDMFREAVKYLYENEEQKFSFTGEMDGIWAKRDWSNIGGRIVLGGFILFSDAQFQPEGVKIRIIGIKDYINNPCKPQIELSNAPIGSTVAASLKKIATNEVVTEEYHREALQFTKRRFRDSKETISMLESAMLGNFEKSISPITVQTMALLLGDESLQFRFVDRKYVAEEPEPKQVNHNVIYNATTKVLNVPKGILQHMTLGIDTISSSHKPNEYKFWTVPEFNTPPLVEVDKKYYLYAKVSKTTEVGEFYISETAIAIESVEGHYHLLMGVLNSEYDNQRSYASMYGFTEVLPGQITTDTIKSSDGQTYFDLLRGEIGGNIKFYAKDGTLKPVNLFEYLTNAIHDGNTEIQGGLALANLIFVKDLQNKIRGGMSGMADDPVAFFAHDDDAYNVAIKYLLGQSTVKPNFAVSKTGDLLANRGFIGNAEIVNGDLILKGGSSDIIITKRSTGEIPMISAPLSFTQVGNDVATLSHVEHNIPQYGNKRGNLYKEVDLGWGNPSYGMYNIKTHLRYSWVATGGGGEWGFMLKTKLAVTSASGIIKHTLHESPEQTVMNPPTGSGNFNGTIELNTNLLLDAGDKLVVIVSGWYDCFAMDSRNDFNLQFNMNTTALPFGTPCVTADQILKQCYLCSDGLMITLDYNNRFSISNSGGRLKIKASLRDWQDVDSGELCTKTVGNVTGVVCVK